MPKVAQSHSGLIKLVGDQVKHGNLTDQQRPLIILD